MNTDSIAATQKRLTRIAGIYAKPTEWLKARQMIAQGKRTKTSAALGDSHSSSLQSVSISPPRA